MTKTKRTTRPLSSLKFLAGVLATNLVSAAFWVSAPAEWWVQMLGLITSFLLLVLGSKEIWDYKLSQFRAPLPKPEALPPAPEGLEKFVVDQLQFAVISVGPELDYRLETRSVPEAMGNWRMWERQDLGELLRSVTSLSTKDIDLLKFQLRLAFGMDLIQWQVTAMGLPREALLRVAQGHYVRMTYVPQFENGLLKNVRMIMQDISEIKQREEQANAQRKEMEKFFALLQVSDSLFELFMGETRRLFDDIRSDLKHLKNSTPEAAREHASRLFRAVHTIKANARLFKLDSIQDVAHHVETYLDDLRQGKIKINPNTLQELTLRMQSISEEIYSYASLRKEILNTADRNSGINLRYRVQWVRSLMSQFATLISDPVIEKEPLALIQKEFSRAMSSFDRSSLRDYIRGYDAMLQEMGSELGKEVVLFTELEFHHFDSIILTRINDILLHCMRNAIDHGIELPELREAMGKPRKGTIAITTHERNGMVEVVLKDDGRGIDVEKVRARAVELGIFKAEQARVMSDEDIVPLLFNVGVSTSTTVTEISGRGLGMDVVRDAIYGMNGQLRLAFEKNESTTISFLIPTSSEDFMAPLAIHDIRILIEDALREYKKDGTYPVVFECGLLGQTTVFADRAVLYEAMLLTFKEIGPRLRPGKPVHVSIEEHLGKRKVDSFVFYRLKIGDPTESRMAELKAKSFDRPTELIRKSSGSLYIKNRSTIEINIPSNIPVPFADYTFKVLIYSAKSKGYDLQVDHFFKMVMGGWHYKVYTITDAVTLPPELHAAACLVLLDSHHIENYISNRTEKDRSRDGIILFSQEDLDIDTLNESGIQPENLLFAPPSFDEKHLFRCLVSIIFRRFLKEMVREKNEAHEVLKAS